MIRFAQIKLIAFHTSKSILKSSINQWLIGGFLVLIAIALSSSYLSNRQHQHDVMHYSKDVREKWENNPDKHPHRMAHYGYVAFREKYPLSFFDKGMDSYLGNAVFLEAHRQNSINFSQVSMSNGLLRFGELSAGLILQLLVPLLIFFWGFSLVAGERTSGTLKLLLSQGVSWREIIIGKALGLFLLSLIILLPSMLVVFALLTCCPLNVSVPHLFLNFGALTWSYIIYLLIMSLLAVWISASSKTQRSALIRLIGSWLFFTLIFPKVSQVTGQVLYPTPSKIEFDTAVEHDIIQQGDSHNPDDPHFAALKDSLLLAHKVTTTNELPFNYSGFIMSKGEQLSTETYRRHQGQLMALYEKQGQIVNWTAFLNPFIAMKSISMSMSGTDFMSYRNFNVQAEEYRYGLAQTMNDLQIKYISNNISSSADKGAVISQPDFQHNFLSFDEMSRSVALSFLALAVWLISLIGVLIFRAKKLSAI